MVKSVTGGYKVTYHPVEDDPSKVLDSRISTLILLLRNLCNSTWLAMYFCLSIFFIVIENIYNLKNWVGRQGIRVVQYNMDDERAVVDEYRLVGTFPWFFNYDTVK